MLATALLALLAAVVAVLIACGVSRNSDARPDPTEQHPKGTS